MTSQRRWDSSPCSSRPRRPAGGAGAQSLCWPPLLLVVGPLPTVVVLFISSSVFFYLFEERTVRTLKEQTSAPVFSLVVAISKGFAAVTHTRSFSPQRNTRARVKETAMK